ncbi:procyclic acidic repetitive family protein [Streptomyces phaeoluteigriseus]|uniref:Procyclic acidic repetitive family protein n=1 Tax=Streptomyces phaeoluteigriseus TaxID=114686 RepID=A0ABY4ZAL0_9ACTN|nr:procyclic acidic repetitive family protein [Streptomyces phaeoluteigriseus]USQ85990.1 procyclic acidic repetitive family protein [Streptomyces phaeoluteigriseus]
MSTESADSTAGRVQAAGQTVKEQASATAGQAGKAAGEVAGTALDQAKTVAGEARQQAGSAVGDLRGRVTEEVEGQTRRAAGTVRQWADDLVELAGNAPGGSPARSLVSQVADGGHRAADYLDDHGVEGMAEDVKGFARRRPGAFLASAALAGFAVGRMAKAGSKAQSGQGSQQDPIPVWRGRSPGMPERTVRPEPQSYPHGAVQPEPGPYPQGTVRPEPRPYPEV